MRSSSATVDPYSGAVLLDRSQECVALVMRALNAPYNFSWSHTGRGPVLRTTVHLTVVAEAGTGWDTARTIVHSVTLPMAKDELDRLCRSVRDGLRRFESVAASTTTTGDLGFGLRTAAFMMGLMAPSLRQSVVVIADGVAAAPDLSVYDSPLMLMNRQGITCHVVWPTRRRICRGSSR